MTDLTNYPVSLDEAKLFMRVDNDYTYDDSVIASLIASETQRYEKKLNLGLVSGVERTQYIADPYCCYRNFVRLNYGPVDRDSIKGYRADGLTEVMDIIVQQGEYPIVFGVPYMGYIKYTSKGLNPFPEDLKRAILMRVAFAYDNRTGLIDSSLRELYVGQNPDTIAAQFNRNPI